MDAITLAPEDYVPFFSLVAFAVVCAIVIIAASNWFGKRYKKEIKKTEEFIVQEAKLLVDQNENAKENSFLKKITGFTLVCFCLAFFCLLVVPFFAPFAFFLALGLLGYLIKKAIYFKRDKAAKK